MKNIKKFLKNILVAFLIFYIVIANTSSSFARNFDDGARNFLATQTEQFINEHKGDSLYTYDIPAVFKGSTFCSCCTTGIAYVYQTFLGLNIYNLGFNALAVTNLTSLQNENWTEVSIANAKPGDILVRDGHAEMVASAGVASRFNFGSGRTNDNLGINSGAGNFTKIFSLNENVQVTPTGSVPASDELLEEENNATEDPEDKFYYQGLAQGSFSGQSSFNLLSWLFNLISQLVDYILGFMTMIVKIVVIGWANIFVNIVTDAVNALTGEAVEELVDNSENTSGDGAQTNVVASSTTQNRTQAILDSDELYTPTSTELQPEGDDKLTIDKIIFNQVPLLDVNMFTDTAGGYTLKDDSSLKIIRDSVATWYYAIRNITIAVMLIILIYIGIKIAISSIASEKAEYKRMLVSWVVGFLIIFIIHFFLIFVLDLNSIILGWITDAQQSMGYEDSIYETVRTKAYEIKFSSGMVGTILYIALIVLMLKFFYIYIKRLLGVCILIIMAPAMGASYAISKVRTGKAKAFTRWMKDFTLLVLMQSVHALIYTCFVTVVLQLTNESMGGIMISLVVMNFMFKATNIFMSIFGMVGDKTGSRSLETIVNSNPRKEILGTMFVAKEVGKSVKSFATGTIEFGKDIKNAAKGSKERRKEIQAQALGYGNLGKKALGKGFLGTKNIDAATGQYVPKGKAEKLTNLSDDLNNEAKRTRENRSKKRKQFVKDLYSIHDTRLSNALKIATALPMLGISGLEQVAATNIASVITGSESGKNIKGPKKTLRQKFTSARANGFRRTMKNSINSGVNKVLMPGEEIQDVYENRMAQINSAKEAESNIINLYKAGRRDKEEEIRELRRDEIEGLPDPTTGRRNDRTSGGTTDRTTGGTTDRSTSRTSDRRTDRPSDRSTDGTDDRTKYRTNRLRDTGKEEKVIKAMAKTSFDDSYRKTIESVFAVSDLVDEKVDAESDMQAYKNSLGINDRALGIQSIDRVKESVREKARENIAEKIREQHNIKPEDKVDYLTEQKIQEETENRLSIFMKDLDKEIDKKVDKHEELENRTDIIKGDRLDYSRSIDSDKLKSTIEDMMKKHNADKKAEDGMEELREQMQKLQRIDRDYASTKGNPGRSYLYKASTDIRSQEEKRSNLKTVLTSLTFRNIDIDGGRR